MGLASISWNSVRVCSKLRTGLFRVLHPGTRFGRQGVSLKAMVDPRRNQRTLRSRDSVVPEIRGVFGKFNSPTEKFVFSLTGWATGTELCFVGAYRQSQIGRASCRERV